MSPRSRTFHWRSARSDGRQREVLTPEGVVLRFGLPGAGDRLGAALIDLTIVIGSAIVVLIVTAVATTVGGAWALAVAFLVFFLLRTSYFTFFELHWQGSTPGKRAVGLRVMDAHGGMLRADAVIVRNLTREVELFLPLTALFFPEAVGSGRGLVALVSILWLVVFALFPLFNRDRLRLGDLIAGTVVVRAPKSMLLPDLDPDQAPRRGSFEHLQRRAAGPLRRLRAPGARADPAPAQPGPRRPAAGGREDPAQDELERRPQDRPAACSSRPSTAPSGPTWSRTCSWGRPASASARGGWSSHAGLLSQPSKDCCRLEA